MKIKQEKKEEIVQRAFIKNPNYENDKKLDRSYTAKMGKLVSGIYDEEGKEDR